MCISFLFFFFSKSCGGGGGGGSRASVGPDIMHTVFQITHQLSTFFLSSFSFFVFDRRIYESVSILSLLVSRLQGYPNIEHLHLADSSLARVGS